MNSTLSLSHFVTSSLHHFITIRRVAVLFTLSQEDQMLKDLVARFVKDELMPLEQKVLARDAAGTGPLTITAEELERLDGRAKELGLWGLDAPAEFGGSDLPVTSMIGV